MKILIVDDEKPARKALMNELGKLGYSNVLQVENGFEALDYIKTENPELVLADIRMPGINGLELLRLVRKNQQDAIFVFISGFDLFEYAKKALQLGAFDYLLKPVRQSDLQNVMNKVVNELDLKSMQHENDFITKIKLSKGLDLMKRKFVSELVFQGGLSETYIRSKCSELDIDLDLEGSTFCIVLINRDYSFNSAPVATDSDLLVSNIENITSEVLISHHLYGVFFDEKDGLGCMLVLDTEEASVDYDKLKEAFAEVIEHINESLHIGITVGIGVTTRDYSRLNESLSFARKGLIQRLVKGGNSVFFVDDFSDNKHDTATIDKKTENDLLYCFEKNDVNKFSTIIDMLYLPLKQSDVLDLTSLKKLNLQLVLLIYKAVKQSGVDPSSLLDDEFMLYNEINSLATIDIMVNCIKEKAGKGLEAASIVREKSCRKILDIAKDFIHKNIANDISLESVAEQVHLSPSHLSRLFRQELGESFVGYVINVRISRARELLKEGVYKAIDVAKLTGFNDEKHFYKMFKKITGLTPGEYKKL